MSTPNESQTLKDAWRDVAQKVADEQTQAIIGGMNIRINVAKAFKAVFITTKAYLKSKVMFATGLSGPAEIMGLAQDVWSIIVTTLDALRERMHPLEYVACVVLASTDGLSESEFKKALEQFLQAPSDEGMPWYLGINHKLLNEARQSLAAPGAWPELLKLLRDRDWLLDSGGKLTFKPRHYTWGLSVN